MSCPSCGAEVDAEDIICPHCLANLTRPATPATPAAEAASAGRQLRAGGSLAAPAGTGATPDVAATTLRLRFPEAGEVTVAPGMSLTLGRDPTLSPAAATLARFDNISRRHAVVGVDPDGTAWVEDARSTNGTFVNGAPVPPAARTHLHHGDELRLAADVTAEVALVRREPR